MNISQMEGRPDWPAIVESVPCPQQYCEAPQGAKCRNLGAAPGTLLAQTPRNDWHSLRKFAAILAWEAFRQQVKEESSGQTQAPSEAEEQPVSVAVEPELAGDSVGTEAEVTNEVPQENNPVDDSSTEVVIPEVTHETENA